MGGAAPKGEGFCPFSLASVGGRHGSRHDGMKKVCIDTAFIQPDGIPDKKMNSADFTKILRETSQIVEKCKFENIIIAFLVKSAIIIASFECPKRIKTNGGYEMKKIIAIIVCGLVALTSAIVWLFPLRQLHTVHKHCALY